ncbi:hypothetical protein [Reichenbachiella ulvae]|uniref:Fibronectin type-III domain-containing protein n=1 Tax=Reichenbachiella ulvae TaxID=2980104 RepID=A0ABT3CSN0_9BACT|nr:hypothetical protein [Reichenbachiella ulvae]MCV9386688.1 hypothetical protein [Reichenbachiella ulvae]
MEFIRLLKNKSWIVLLLILICNACSNEDDSAPGEAAIEDPVLSTPIPLVNEINLDWTDYQGAVAYEVDVASDIDFDQMLDDYNSLRVSQSILQIENLEPATTYFIRIRAVLSEEIISANSNVQSVTTLPDGACSDPVQYLFVEKDGIVKVEFENAEFGNSWKLVADSESSGRGYMLWTGTDNFSKPSADLTSFDILISTPGTYHFVWRSAYTIGDKGTEHNDTWLRFPDASDYYAQKSGGPKVYPKGVGKTPNPEGASSDGWFKNYRSGNDKGFKWQSRTNDFDPYQIYVAFNEAKSYTMEVSGRSNGHAVDQFVLHLESVEESNAISAEFSEIICQ